MENPAAAPPPRPPERLRWLDLVPVLLFTVLRVILVIALVVTHGLAAPGHARQPFIQHPPGLSVLALALLVTAVAAPLCEEAFFRGMVFRLLSTRVPVWAAVVLSAAAFGLAHASPAVSVALLPVFPYLGVGLALAYAWSRSLTNAVLLHSLNNAVGTVAVYVLLTRSVS